MKSSKIKNKGANKTIFPQKKTNEIAIIGIACRFPGANDYHQFWDNLIKGKNSIREISPDRWDINQYYSPDINAENKSVSKWGGLLDHIDQFASQFFNISPREAQAMDPQQRLLLEEAWHCIEDAGVALNELQQNKTSIYIGVMANDYQHLFDSQHLIDSYDCLGNYEGILANRLSYFLNFTGNSQTFDAACASSLVSLHEAKKSICQGESDYALAGGVSIICHPWKYISFSKSRMLSPDGQCKTFDAQANGYVPGEGVGLVLLCSLEKALEKKYSIYGIIKGSAVKHTGKSTSITAPRIEIEKHVVQEALKESDVNPEYMTYVEAHGTGTSLGDPIEIEALTQAFDTAKKQYCHIGSVKTNIGHLEAAAGIAGVIKVLLMMKYKKIPQTLNIKKINPIIDFANTPFKPAEKLVDWNESVYLAGVSSFGFGGINAHLVLEAFVNSSPENKKEMAIDLSLPFILSAKTDVELKNLLQQWQNYTKTTEFNDQSLVDICYTLMRGRENFPCRFATLVRKKEEIVSDLKREKIQAVDKIEKSLVLYLKPLNKLYYADLQKIAEYYPVLTKIEKEFYEKIGHLRESIDLNLPPISQFVAEFILSQAILKSGLQPDYIMGEGIGGLVAAVLSGIIDLNAAIDVLSGKNESIHLKRPVFRFYDFLTQRVIEPYQITALYCSKLIDQIQIEPSEQDKIFNLARELLINQMSFKKYFHEWNNDLLKFNIDLTRFDFDYQKLNNKQQLLFSVIFLVCLKKLNQKWNLADKVNIKNDAIDELINLILDETLSYELAMSLFLIPTADTFQKVARYIENNQHTLQANKSYTLLKTFNEQLLEIADQKVWLNELINKSNFPEREKLLSNTTPFYIDIDEKKLNPVDFKNSLDLYLVNVWQSGIHIDLSAWFSHPFQTVSLPVYCYTRENYWVSRKKKSDIEKNREEEQKEQETTAERDHSVDDFLTEVQNQIISVVSKVLRKDSNTIRAEHEFNQYGMDSIAITELSMELNEYYGIELNPTVLFEHKTIKSFSNYLIKFHPAVLSKHQIVKKTEIKKDIPKPAPAEKLLVTPRSDIAIIGISGVFPQSPTLNIFWENLLQQKDLITEVPRWRWDWKEYDGDKNKTKVNRGGFIEDIDKFDAKFFHISPKEAELMDPQQRLFIEIVWKLIENAGYDIDDLTKVKTGLYVGVCTSDYAEILQKNHNLSSYAPTGTFHSILANRISFLFNFNGPSEPIDTACSSSLVAIHHAVNAIQNGDCDVAIAGGVNALLTPTLFIEFSHAGMLSEDGRCKTFDKSANGYVRGEGAGAILLKPLKKALEEGDHIYGIIKSTAVNHGGRVNSLTVPNPNAQAELITTAIEKANVDITTLHYIETHGTGTSLGDPIEINGLKKAFEIISQKQNKKELPHHYCGLGAIKTNIGHLEAAAGIAGVIKALLAMENEIIPANIHLTEINPYIELNDTPFYILDKPHAWKRGSMPRRAGISSFGFGGVNAHVILEESCMNMKKINPQKPYYLVTLSAQTESALKQKIMDLENWLIQNESVSSPLLEEIVYTLNAGRHHFNKRCALIVSSLDDLKQKLIHLKQENPIQDYFQGESEDNQNREGISSDTLLNETIEKLKIEKNKDKYKEYLSLLATYYLKGFSLSWKDVHHNESQQRIALPTYPFNKVSYWVSTPHSIEEKMISETLSHPLIEKNHSTGEKFIYTKLLKENAFYLNDHRVQGMPVLPAVAYLEMARAAGQFVFPNRSVSGFKNIIWMQPIRVLDQEEVEISILPKENHAEFEIKTIHLNQMCSQGKIIYDSTRKLKKININDILNRCPNKKNKTDVYSCLNQRGLNYGLAFQVIDEFYNNDQEVLTKINLSKELNNHERKQFILHPSLFDGALQSIVSLLDSIDSEHSTLYLPFSMDEVEIYSALEDTCYAHAVLIDNKNKEMPKFSLTLMDKTGQVCLAVKNFSIRVAAVKQTTSSPLFYFHSVWKQRAVQPGDFKKDILIIEHQQDIASILKMSMPQVNIRVQSFTDPIDTVSNFIIFNAKQESDKNYHDLLNVSQQLIRLHPRDNIELLCRVDKTQGSAISAFLKTLELEQPKIKGRVVEVEWIEDMINELQQTDLHVRYDAHHTRWIQCYEETFIPSSPSRMNSLLKQQGVYLITGGMGGLGKIFAQYLAKKYQAKLILMGRTPLRSQHQSFIHSLENRGAEVIYYAVDIAKHQKLAEMIDASKQKFGKINGIIHCAGVLQDNYILNKKMDDARKVLVPKITGAINLDELTKNEELDFFVLFSSIVSIIGNVGQSDYAFANGFMDDFAQTRDDLCKINKRTGKTISFNWPLWATGGMQVEESAKKWIENKFGLIPMESESGIQAFETSLVQNEWQQIICSVNKNKIFEKLGIEEDKNKKINKEINKEISKEEILIEKVANNILKMIAKILKINKEEINIKEKLSYYGADSIAFMELSLDINEYYQIELSPTEFFEHVTLFDLATYLIHEYPKLVESTPTSNSTSSVSIAQPTAEPLNMVDKTVRQEASPRDDDIAIIGISGIFPGAEDLNVFWRNLEAKKDAIIEIPKSRWDWQTYFGNGENETKVKWGGFIEGIDEFDAEFFAISPYEAELMDPQQRLFLQIVYKTVEDSGYTAEHLSKIKTGLFVGASTHDYLQLLNEENIFSPQLPTGIAHSVLANRVSYLLNWHGPSEAIDTACSSSLIAIHHAVKAIQNGDCEVAIAGGVNALLTKSFFIAFSKAGMLSEDGKCKTFDKSANGYVRGEGVGAIMLKPLAKALADHDHIYGIIKGTAINHGGEANTLTSPNPLAQADVIATAIQRAHVDIDTITYIEAHGSGTALGDPIEVNGLKKAFSLLKEIQNKKQLPDHYCGIGTVKTNIGHLEAAAGIAGILKVLLAMKYKKIPGMLNFSEINPYIELKNSPFYIVEQTKEWETIKMNDSTRPRRAGVSSFGFGGANAHVVLEEAPFVVNKSPSKKPYYLLTLSAKTESALQQKIIHLAEWLANTENSATFSLEEISYTLNKGRSHYKKRCALVVADINDLKDKLSQLKTGKIANGCFKEDNETKVQDVAIYKKILKIALEELQKQNNSVDFKDNLETLANLYIKGYDFDWDVLHQNESHRRISLPTYPFAKNHYWVSKKKETNSSNIINPIITVEKPIIHNNESLTQKTENHLKNILAEAVKIDADRILSDTPFEQYGINSLMVINLNNKLEREFGDLPKTLFFEYKSLRELTNYFVENHASIVADKFSMPSTDVRSNQHIKSELFIPPEKLTSQERTKDIAIIGISGRYPQAKDLDDFWDNLKIGKDCITEIPKSRWDSTLYFDEDKEKEDKVYSKWGSFIEDIDKFDASFFHISPREAELMDPQERLFLETTWKTLEDAGQTSESLQDKRVGVFVGVMYGEYQLFGAEETLQGHPMATHATYASIANRVSYYFNFHGPSIALDTMCSSSLTSLHLACKSIQHGECDLAIAGGVNVSIHPNKYLMLSRGKFLASDGYCKSFGEGGDGYVPGEGVGAVLLKPLDQAIKEGDIIYGVIKGSSINHGGKTNNYTVPSPVAQAAVIEAALKDANMTSDYLSYVEAHGTGTTLGDPIEIRGLAKAFNTLRDNLCPIGSIKSNMGHLESAAGIAAVTKVLLQMQHHTLVPSLHSEHLNKNIDFEKTPFRVQQTLAEWKQPTLNENGVIKKIPRMAGISSFGAGGANAHLIIEEPPILKSSASLSDKPCYLITFSAKTEESLKIMLKNYVAWLNKKINVLSLQAISYTLNLGRDHFDYRCAWVASSIEELKNKLSHWEEQRDFYGKINEFDKDPVEEKKVLDKVTELANLIHHNHEQYKKDLEEIANDYVKGYKIDWKLLHRNESIQKISLPTYPFLKERHWYDNYKLRENISHKLKLKSSVMVPQLDNINETNKIKLSNMPLILPVKENHKESHDVKETQPIKMENTMLNGDEKLKLEHELTTLLAGILCLDVKKIPKDKVFADLGMDSIYGVEFIRKINSQFQINLLATKLYDCPTIESLVNFMISQSLINSSHSSSEKITAPVSSPIASSTPVSDIAIIGLAGEFPGAKNMNEFWRNLTLGKSSITEIPASRWSIAEFYDPDKTIPHKSYCKEGGFIEEIDQFDPLFFNILPSEAEWMDPQQRLLLQTAWSALEDAGYSTQTLDNMRCGIYAGVMNNDYAELISRYHPTDRPAEWITGNSNSILAARICYYLNLKGPAVSLDTACSSSLVAIYLACKALEAGEAEMMLAGGVTLYLTETPYIGMCKAGMLSPQGKCKTFDTGADGFVPGEGVGVVVLKRLDKALSDHDHIYGIIKGAGMNQDGKTNGITAPSSVSQKELELEVYHRYNIDPQTISYVEAHGTGTKLGDPVELTALTEAFRVYTNKKQFCAMGSVKTNIGHTSAAAGVASLAKLLLCLQHKKLVPSLNFYQANEHIDFKNSPFYVNTEYTDWKNETGLPRRAAISSFGFSGTNMHAVIEEPPADNAPLINVSKPYYLVTLSAKTEFSLNQKIQDMASWLADHLPTSFINHFTLEDIAYTLNQGRTHFEKRLAIIVNSIEHLQETIGQIIQGHSLPHVIFSHNNNKKPFMNDKNEIDKLLQLLSLNSTLSKEDYFNHLLKLAEWYSMGYDISWSHLHQGESKRRISLPTYPFAKKRYWISNGVEKSASSSVLLETKKSVENAFQIDEALLKEIKNIVLTTLKLEEKDLDFDTSIVNLGLDSISATRLAKSINDHYQLAILPSLFFEFTTLRELAHYLYQHHLSSSSLSVKKSVKRIAPIDKKTEEKSSTFLDIETMWEETTHTVKKEITVPIKKLLLSEETLPETEVIIAGQGEPLLLLGGVLQSHTMWHYQIKELSKRYQLIMINPPGCGRSVMDPHAFSFSTLVKTSMMVLDNLNIKTAIPIIGYSFGGMIALSIALAHPERVSALILACAAAKTSGLTQKYDLFLKELDDAKTHFPNLFTVIDQTMLSYYLAIGKEFNVIKKLNKIEIPTLIIVGEKDTYILPEYSIAIHHQIKSSHYLLINNAGHGIPFTHHQPFNKAIIEFLFQSGNIQQGKRRKTKKYKK